jgi:hypothetical protein
VEWSTHTTHSDSISLYMVYCLLSTFFEANLIK